MKDALVAVGIENVFPGTLYPIIAPTPVELLYRFTDDEFTSNVKEEVLSTSRG